MSHLKTRRLAVLATHPVQYFVPIFRALNKSSPHLECHVFLGCLHGVSESSYDRDFDSRFAWDCDLLSGYNKTTITKSALHTLSGIRGVLLGVKAAFQIMLWRPDAVLIFAYSPAFISSASFILTLFDCHILLRADTSEEAYIRSPFRQFGRTFLLQGYYRRIGHIFPIGAHSYEHFLDLDVPPNMMSTVLYAIDQKVLPPASDITTQPVNRSRLQVLFLGKLTPQKDPGLILRALLYLTEAERNSLSVTFAGSGPLLSDLKHLASSNALPVTYHGFVNQSELLALYSNYDLLVLPSVQGEVWGLVVNEALSQGLRVIVSDRVGSRHDLVPNEDAGWVFQATNARSLARSLRLALQQWPWTRAPHATPSVEELVNRIEDVLL